jgi:hypothetical protein
MIVHSRFSKAKTEMADSAFEQRDDRDDLGQEAAGDTSHDALRDSRVPLAIVLFVFSLSIYMLSPCYGKEPDPAWQPND